MKPSEIVDEITDVMASGTDFGKAIYAVEYEDDEVGSPVAVMVFSSHAEEARRRFSVQYGPTVEVIEHDPEPQSE